MPHTWGWEHPGATSGPTNIPCVHASQPVTKTGFSGENMDTNMDLNVGSLSGSTGCPRLSPASLSLKIPAVHPSGNLPGCPYV